MTIIILILGLFLGYVLKVVANGLIEEQPMTKWQYKGLLVKKKQVYELIFLQLLIGMIGVFLYQKYGLHLEFYQYIFFTVMMILIGFIDFKTTYVYRSTTLITGLGGVFFILCKSIQSQSWPIDALIGGLIGLVVIGLIVFLTRGMGEGDIEIAILAGLFLGTQGSLITLFFGFVLGGIAGAILLSLKSKGLKDEMAFGPYLVMGSFISMLVGHEIVSFYLNLYH